MEFEEIISGFAQKFGIEGLAPNEEGSVLLDIDGMAVELLHDADAGDVLICAEIGEPPPEGEKHFAEMLLRANFLFQGTGGATFAQNPESKAYALIRPFALAGLDLEDFCAQVGKFVDGLERWRQLLEDFREVGESVSDDDSDGFNPLGGSGFMSV
ncbi:MAG: type III secretion system chaperone [Kiritimatiellae bacterium]|nr:type III secretion system chaperone [Kiritimatiellia bacterium]